MANFNYWVWEYSFKPGAQQKWEAKISQATAGMKGNFHANWGQEGPISGAVVHGHQQFTHGAIALQHGVDERRAENVDYDFDGTTPMTIDEDVWDLGDVYERVESLSVVPLDDEELTELGEERWHEQMTSHIGELMKIPEDELTPKMKTTLLYVMHSFIASIEGRQTPSWMLWECWRQKLGLPYEWIGAKPE